MKLSLLTVLIAIFAIACSSNQSKKTDEVPVQKVELVYHVEGMTCDHCEKSIQKGVNVLDGIAKVEANHEDSTTLVVFDPAKTDKKQIAEAIEKRGFKVIE